MPESGELRWSGENHRIHGVPPGERVTLERMMGIVHPDDRERVRDDMERIAREGEGRSEYRLLLQDGAVEHVQTRGRAEREPGGGVRCVGTTLDITGAEDGGVGAARERGALPHARHGDHADGLERRPGGNVADPPEWRDHTGRTAEEIRGAGWLDAVHPEDRSRVRAA